MLDKLYLINIGDTIEYMHEHVRCKGEVHGWRLTPGREHHAIVGSSVYHEHEVSLRSITARSREKGHDKGTVSFL